MKLPFNFEVGDVVIPMPVGIYATLQYDLDGKLEKIYKGFDGQKDITNLVMDFARTHNWVPMSISVTKGTSWVHGVFYTGTQFVPEKLGNISKEFDDSLMRLLSDYPQQFNFFAVDFKSTAFAIKGYRNINSWLNSGLFKTLNSVVILTGTHNTFTEDVSNVFPFPFPEISGYYIYHGVETSYTYTDIEKEKIAAIDPIVDPSGYVCYKCIFEDSTYGTTLTYDAVADNEINENDVIYLHDSKLIAVHHKSSVKHDYSHYSCPTCGRVTVYDGQAAMRCCNEECTSRLYFDINRLLEVLKLPSMDYGQYTQEVASGNISRLEDVFNITPYNEMKVSSSIGDILDGLIPFEQLRNRQILHLFVAKCCNSLLTIRSYIDASASTISKELMIPMSDSMTLHNAFTDRVRRLFNTLVELPNIELTAGALVYQNAPIFRNKTIAITGDFVHGVTSQIVSILSSYGAIVKTHFDNTCDCLIVGDKNENVSGLDVRRATKQRKDIFSEGYFFSHYDIDSDLKSQLM